MVTQELLNYIKQQVAIGKDHGEIKDVLMKGGGWHSEEIDEAFRVLTPISVPTQPPSQNMSSVPISTIGTTPMTSQAFVSMQHKSRHFGKLIVIVFIVGLIFLGWKMYGGNIGVAFNIVKNTIMKKGDVDAEIINSQNQENSLINTQEGKDESILLETDQKTGTKTTTSSTPNNFLEVGPLKLIYPLEGQSFISGQKITIKYEILKDNPIGLISIKGSNIYGEECSESIGKKLAGKYSIDCILPNDIIGPVEMLIMAFDGPTKDISNAGKILEDGTKFVTLNFKAPIGIKPTEIVLSEPNILAFVPGPRNVSGPYTASTNMIQSIKYSDGIVRHAPLSLFKYTFDDPTLVRFWNNEKSYLAFIGNKVGKTILHLSYEGLKKDITIITEDDGDITADDEKVYDMTLQEFKNMCIQKVGKFSESEESYYCDVGLKRYWMIKN